MRSGTRRALVSASIAAACAAMGFTGSAGAATTSKILGFYNADRQANGLPAVSTVNPAMQQGCAGHDNYMALNHVLDHGEDPSKPGYTRTGNYLDGAQGGEVLADDYGWTSTYDPWHSAPIHLSLLFNPDVAQVGYADLDGYQCMRMRGPDAPQPPVLVVTPGPAPAPPPPTNSFYAWTGDSGRIGVPTSERAAEVPYTPQQLVGIPASQVTGPNILLFSQGDPGTPESATLTGPQGPVQTALINYDTQNSVGDGKWFYGGGVLLPVKPLSPHTTYNATVTWQDDGTQVQQFSFTTGARTVQSTLRLNPRADRRGRWRFLVSGSPRIGLTVTRVHRPALHPRVRRGRTSWLRFGRAVWQACASSLDETHPALTTCVNFDSRGRPHR